MRIPGKKSKARASHTALLCELTGILPEQDSGACTRYSCTPFQVPRLHFSVSSGCRNAGRA